MADFILEISDSKVAESSGEYEGRAWKRRVQAAHVALPGQRYPVPVDVRLQGDQAPYPPGRYRWTNPVQYRKGEIEVPRFFDLEKVDSAAKPAGTRAA